MVANICQLKSHKAWLQRLLCNSHSFLPRLLASADEESTSVMLLTNQCNSHDELCRRSATSLASPCVWHWAVSNEPYPQRCGWDCCLLRLKCYSAWKPVVLWQARKQQEAGWGRRQPLAPLQLELASYFRVSVVKIKAYPLTERQNTLKKGVCASYYSVGTMTRWNVNSNSQALLAEE